MYDKHNITPKEALQEWLARIKIPRQALDGHSICPFSKGISVPTPEYLHMDENFIAPSVENIRRIKVYTVTNLNITPESMDSWCSFYANKFPDLIFLADHKDRKTFINGIQTNNGYYNFMLCQPKKELNEARDSLIKTNYYSFWDENYLKDVWGKDYQPK
ncbi:hypothetical protein EBU71_00220 [bacterium]|nr:hypothetical protein [Candidatus Elulimicrobium humile]